MQKCAALLMTGACVVSAHDLLASSDSIESPPSRVADRVWAPNSTFGAQDLASNSVPLVLDKAGRLDRHLTTSCPDMPSGNSTTGQGGGSGASTEIMGWLVDLLCWDRADHLAIDGAVLDEEPWMHSAHCMHLGGPIHPEHKDTATDCYHSGFGIIQESLPSSGVYDLVYRLDDVGNMKAQQLVDNMCAGTRNVWVKVFTDGNQMAGSGSGSSAAPMIGVECLMWVQGGREVESGDAGRRLQNQPSHITCPGGDSQVQQCWDITLAECTSAFDALPMHPTPAPPAPSSTTSDDEGGVNSAPAAGLGGAMLALSASALWQ